MNRAKIGFVAAVLLQGSLAFAQGNWVNSISLISQQTSQWCWAANTEMVAKFNGSTVSQCEQANQMFNPGVDCCSYDYSDGSTNPPPSKCVGTGAYADDAMRYWGLDFDITPPRSAPKGTVASVSYSFLKSEIDNGRPIVTGWTWKDGGAHYVLVHGYYSANGINLVNVFTPAPKNHGEDLYPTFEEFLHGDGSQENDFHDVTRVISNIHWAPICSYDFADFPADKYQECFDQRTHHGQFPSAIASGGNTMSGAFHGDDSRPVVSGWSLADLKGRVNTLSNSGWRPLMITVSSLTTPLYNAIWTQESSTWQTQYASSRDQFIDTYNSIGNSYRLRDLFAYQDGTNVTKFSGTWVQEGGGYHFETHIAKANFDDTDAIWRNKGYRTTRISTYYENGSWYVAALWLPSTVSYYRVVLNDTAAQYQTDYDTWVTGKGYSVAYTSQYGELINAIFTK